MVEKQINLIRKMDWDYLIILDACRYDYFEKVYREYLKEGKLRKVISPASHTLEWAQKVFLNTKLFQKVVYISANPYINSKKPINGIYLRPMLKKIYDIWLTDWDKKINTVHPKDLTEKTIGIIRKNKDSKMIIHYLQPHAPYLTEKVSWSFSFKLLSEKKKRYKSIIPEKIRNHLNFFLHNILPLPILKIYWNFQIEIKKSLPRGEIIAFAKLSLKRWRKAYEENLRIALKYVKELVEFIPNGKIVITADHGELLGDRFWFGYKISHRPHVRYKELIEVPWLEIDKGKKEIGKVVEGEEKGEDEERKYSKKDEEIIKERLRALGYLE